MLLRLWLDNVLIWLLLKSLERKQQIHKTHTGSTVHTCVNKLTHVHRLYGFCNAPPIVYCTQTVTPHQGQTKSQKWFNTEYSLLVVIKSKVQEAQTKSQSLSVFFFLLLKKMCVNRTKLCKVGVNYLCESIQYLSTEVLRVRLTWALSVCNWRAPRELEWSDFHPNTWESERQRGRQRAREHGGDIEEDW